MQSAYQSGSQQKGEMARRIHCTNSVFELLGTGGVFQALLQSTCKRLDGVRGDSRKPGGRLRGELSSSQRSETRCWDKLVLEPGRIFGTEEWNGEDLWCCVWHERDSVWECAEPYNTLAAPGRAAP